MKKEAPSGVTRSASRETAMAPSFISRTERMRRTSPVAHPKTAGSFPKRGGRSPVTRGKEEGFEKSVDVSGDVGGREMIWMGEENWTSDNGLFGSMSSVGIMIAEAEGREGRAGGRGAWLAFWLCWGWGLGRRVTVKQMVPRGEGGVRNGRGVLKSMKSGQRVASRA